MRRLSIVLIIVVAAMFSDVFLGARPAEAIPPFYKQFLNEYIADNENTEYVELVKKKVKCLICHQGKKKKDHWHHNPYGELLEERLDKKEDKKNVEKIVAALKEVAGLPYNPDDPNSETFGERIAAGKLPGADSLEELQASHDDDDHDDE